MSRFVFLWLIAFVVLAAIYNPTQYNYYAWAQQNYAAQQPLVIGLGVMLLLLFLVFVVGTLRTMGWVGIVLLAVILGLLSYILVTNGVLVLEMSTKNIWGCLVILSLILGAAMSWRSPSKIKPRKTTKQAKLTKQANA
jgi:hypothetical protein